MDNPCRNLDYVMCYLEEGHEGYHETERGEAISKERSSTERWMLRSAVVGSREFKELLNHNWKPFSVTEEGIGEKVNRWHVAWFRKVVRG